MKYSNSEIESIKKDAKTLDDISLVDKRMDARGRTLYDKWISDKRFIRDCFYQSYEIKENGSVIKLFYMRGYERCHLVINIDKINEV